MTKLNPTTKRLPVPPGECWHPPSALHAVDYGGTHGGVIMRWCMRCGSLWYRYGWDDRPGKWRAPEAARRAKKQKAP